VLTQTHQADIDITQRANNSNIGFYIPQKKDRAGFTVKCSDEISKAEVERSFLQICK